MKAPVLTDPDGGALSDAGTQAAAVDNDGAATEGDAGVPPGDAGRSDGRVAQEAGREGGVGADPYGRCDFAQGRERNPDCPTPGAICNGSVCVPP